ncbi:MAG: hypothetical protein ACF8R9_16205, partial [Phycisphaerales bacterium JB054]
GGGASSNPDHPQSDPTPPLLTLPTPALTPDESQILEYLLHPDADPAAVAAAYSLTLTDLALWLRQPHIQQAQDALRQLHTLQRRAWQDQVTKEAVETLRNVMHAAEDPVERRRAAAAILRALTRTNRTPRRPSNNPTNQPTHHTDSPPQPNTPQHQSPTDTYPAAAAATPDTPNTTPHTKPSTKPAPDDWDHPDHWCNSPAFQAVYRTLDECRARTAAKDKAQAKPETKADTNSEPESETEAEPGTETNPDPNPTNPTPDSS